jgi:hypothetical protein
VPVPKNAYGTANAVVLAFPVYETVFVVLEIVIWRFLRSLA